MSQVTESMMLNMDPYNEKHPKSLVNLLSVKLKDRFYGYSVQEKLRWGEERLVEELKPSQTLRRLRLNLWSEYTRMQEQYSMKCQRKAHTFNQIGHENLCIGICHPKYFIDNVMNNDLALAYLFTPPVDYEILLQESLELGYEKLKGILSFPIYDEENRPNTKVAEIILKTVALLDLRYRGSIPQTVNQRSISLNVNQSRPQKGAVVDTSRLDEELMSIEDLDKRINSIRSETKELINNPTYTLSEREYVLSKSSE